MVAASYCCSVHRLTVPLAVKLTFATLLSFSSSSDFFLSSPKLAFFCRLECQKLAPATAHKYALGTRMTSS